MSLCCDAPPSTASQFNVDGNFDLVRRLRGQRLGESKGSEGNSGSLKLAREWDILPHYGDARVRRGRRYGVALTDNVVRTALRRVWWSPLRWRSPVVVWRRVRGINCALLRALTSPENENMDNPPLCLPKYNTSPVQSYQHTCSIYRDGARHQDSNRTTAGAFIPQP